LRPAADAVILDTDGLALDDVVDRIVGLPVERGAVLAQPAG
jgi:hypothetical protein